MKLLTMLCIIKNNQFPTILAALYRIESMLRKKNEQKNVLLTHSKHKKRIKKHTFTISKSERKQKYFYPKYEG